MSKKFPKKNPKGFLNNYRKIDKNNCHMNCCESALPNSTRNFRRNSKRCQKTSIASYRSFQILEEFLRESPKNNLAKLSKQFLIKAKQNSFF